MSRSKKGGRPTKRDKMSGMTRRLHLRCGSDIKDALEIAKISGDFASFGDPICEGPCPGSLTAEAFMQVRAAFMQRHWEIDPAQSIQRFTRDKATLATLDNYDEILLWFEHDLFDQCILLQLLAGIPSQALAKTSLICIDSYPGIERFIGLGQLSPEELKSLLPQAQAIGAEHQAVAQQALDAWYAPDPTKLWQLTHKESCGPLLFLPEAIKRHLQELPSHDQGLGRTDKYILDAIQSGAGTALEVFRSYQSKDPAPYLGDLMFWAHLHDLAADPGALIEMQGEFPIERLSLTELGRGLLSNERNYMQLQGCAPDSLYRWRGGIEQKPEQGWYYAWDRQVEKVTQRSFRGA